MNFWDNDPISFESNIGQEDNNVKYLVKSKDYKILFKEDSLVCVNKIDNDKRINIKLSKVKENIEIKGEEKLKGIVNYLSCYRSEMVYGVPTYRKIKYKEIYDGIDLIFYGNGTEIESDFIINPGADINNIILNIEDAESISINENNDLCISKKDINIFLKRPISYQIINNKKVEIESSYYINNDNSVSFNIGEFDKTKILIIDPIIEFGYILAQATVISNGIKVRKDNGGNIYVLIKEVYAGGTPGDFLGCLRIKKYDKDGEVIFSSEEIANAKDEATDRAPIGRDMIIDNEGSIYITGAIQSIKPLFSSVYIPSKILPIKPEGKAIQSEPSYVLDAFVMKLDNMGKIVYSTYFSGSKYTTSILEAPQTQGTAIAVDSNKNLWITGVTSTKKMILVNAFQKVFKGIFLDAFVAKIDSSGTKVLFSSYLGGTADDAGYGISVDKSDNVYIVGEADAINQSIPGARGNFLIQDAYQPKFADGAMSSGFITKLNSYGAVLFSTYFGGYKGVNNITDVICDNKGSIYITGITGGDFKVTEGAYLTNNYNDVSPYSGQGHIGFISKFSDDGKKLLSSTYIGGSNDMYSKESMILMYTTMPTTFMNQSFMGIMKAIDLDTEGNVYVTGQTASFEYPVTRDAYQADYYDSEDCVVSKLSGDLKKLLFSTFIGGESHDTGNSIVVDNNNGIYIVGQTTSNEFKNTDCRTVNNEGSGFFLKITI